jgi:tetratricopeptide (TPR) repeat protein
MTLFVSSADIAALPPADTADLGEWLRARFGPEWTKASRIARTAAAFGESDQAKAEAQYKEALATNPRAKWVLAQYCRFLESRKRASDIEVVARSFFERQTSDPFALLLLGGAMLRLGRSEEAVRAYRKACEVSPMANSWYWLGCALWEKGDWDGMTAAFEKAIAGCSRNSPAMQVLTRYYGRNKRYEDAIRVAELWAGSFPMDENAVAALVSLYRDSGDEKRMRQAVERLRRLNPYLANRAELK